MKIAIVTGGTKGIGKSIVELLLSNNYRVFTCYSKDKQSAHDLLNRYDSNRLVIDKVDLANVSSAVEWIKRIIKSIDNKRIDCMVFNAGGGTNGSLKNYPNIRIEDWDECFNINLNSPFFMLQQAYDSVSENGRIIFISSVMSIYEHSGSIAYGVSKASVNALTKYLVKYYCERNITINSIITGFTSTDMVNRTPEHEKRITDKISLHRYANPKEIAQLVWHIINNDYMNGSLIEIDGGYCYK